MKGGAIILILGIFLIGAGIYLLVSQPQANGPSNVIPNTTNNPPSENTQNGTPGGTPQTHSINIQNSAFSPSALTVKQGDTVLWTNMDSMSHTITSDSGGELASPNINNGQAYSHIFNTIGTFAYHCSIHPYMKGTIIVE